MAKKTKTLHEMLLDLGFKNKQICLSDIGGVMSAKYRYGSSPGERKEVILVPARLVPEACIHETQSNLEEGIGYSVIYVQR